MPGPACASPPEPLSSAAIDPDHLKPLAWIKNLKCFCTSRTSLLQRSLFTILHGSCKTQDKKCPDFKFRLTSSLGSHFFFSLGKERVHTKPSSAPHPAEQRRPGAARAGVIAFNEVLGLHATDHSAHTANQYTRFLP